MNAERSKARLALLINEAEQKIEEARKAGDAEIRRYYEGSLYCAKMMMTAMDCKLKVVNGKKYVADDEMKKNI